MITCLAVAILLSVASALYLRKGSNHPPLPPGPKGNPVIGNLLQIEDPAFAWRTHVQWIKQYGPLVYVNMAGVHIVLVGNNEIAEDLLSKRGEIYSGRPRSIMLGELATRGYHLLIRPYNDRYKLHQRLQAPLLSNRASKTYREIQANESLRLLSGMLAAEDKMPDFDHLFHRYSGSIIHTIVYGNQLETGLEQNLLDAQQVTKNFNKFLTPGAYLVESIPALKALPATLAPWKREAEDSYELESSMHLSNMDAGLANPGFTFAKQLSSSNPAKAMNKVELAYSIGVIADAAMDTTGVSLEWFIMAMLKYPEQTEKAWAEIDNSIGRDRLPNFDDIEHLPYINAFINETLRWRSILAGGMPHTVAKADIYNGHYIPKDSIILPVLYAINRDPEIYAHADDFDAERWIRDPSLQPPVAFGYGRRICTGRHIAYNSLWIAVTRILWAFKITAPIDRSSGREVAVDSESVSKGLAMAPLPFKAVFERRGPWVKQLVETSWEESEKDVGVTLDRIGQAFAQTKRE